MCLADFACNYVSKKAVDLEPDDIKSFTVPVSSIVDAQPCQNIIVLKNELGETFAEADLVLCIIMKILQFYEG